MQVGHHVMARCLPVFELNQVAVGHASFVIPRELHRPPFAMPPLPTRKSLEAMKRADLQRLCKVLGSDLCCSAYS